MSNVNNPLSVAHVSSPITWRGGEQQLFYLYSYLKKKGIRQIVFCPENSELSRKVEADECITYKKRSGFDVLAARKIAADCRNNQIDIIQAHDAHAHTFCVLAADLFGLKVPIVLSRRVDFPISKSFFSKYKYNHKSIVAIACVSDAIANIVRSGLESKNQSKAVTIHSGVEPARFSGERTHILRNELGISEDQILVGNVAALADHKDYPTFLRTINHLKSDTRLSFVIIGDGPLSDEIHEMAEKMGLKHRIHFTGYRNDLHRTFADLDILLFTSKTEGLGTTVLDAFANKVAVVATAAGGIPEMIIDQETGLLCKVGDDESLAKSVIQLVENSKLRESLISNGMMKLKEFTSTHMAEKTFALYKRILNNSINAK